MAKAKTRKKVTKADANAQLGTISNATVGPDTDAVHNCILQSVGAQMVIDHAQGQKQGEGSISQHLLKAAQTFPTLDSFKAEIGRQEIWLKSSEGITAANHAYPGSQFNGKMPRCWVQAKSNILATWTLDDQGEMNKDTKGFKLKQCANESQMRKALNRTRDRIKKDTSGKRDVITITDVAANNAIADVATVLHRFTLKAKDDENAQAVLDTVIKDLHGKAREYKALLDKLVPEKPVKKDKANAA